MCFSFLSNNSHKMGLHLFQLFKRMWPVEKVLINLFCVLSFVLIYLSNLVLVKFICLI